MSAEAKALLDELMGRSRNLDPSQQPDDITWNDEDVCKYYLCGFCPHELFTNTRADLGACSKIHDEAFKKGYEVSPKFEKCGYEESFLRFLNSLINDVEKRIKRGHQRLALNSQQATLNGSSNGNEEKITMLTERINDLVVQAEELGCEGKVEESQGVMKLVDQLKEERHQLETKPVAADESGGPLMKQMEVCEVCGAFLIVGDAPQRQDEHLMGKQHAGYAQVRNEIERRKQKTKDELDAKEASKNKMQVEREEREKERQREKEEKLSRERDSERRRDRERDRDRDRGGRDRGERRRKSRSRSRDRGKDRRRSRSRERRRQRSSSRDRRSRRSRSRNRDRDSRKRSSSRGKKSRRSSSRDKRRDSRRSSRERSSHSRHRSGSKDRSERKSRDKDSSRNGVASCEDGGDRPLETGVTSQDTVADGGEGSNQTVAREEGQLDSSREKESGELTDRDEGEIPDDPANCEGDTKMDE